MVDSSLWLVLELLEDKVSRILELLRAEGLRLERAKSVGPKAKVLGQEHAMLTKLGKVKSSDEMDSKSSNQNWWAIKPTGDCRRMTMRYGD